jgi:pyrroloquinoline-quinone synthase
MVTTLTSESATPLPWTREEFTAALRAVGEQHYHDKHPFHALMNEGRLTREQIRVWVANRFYYQKNIPIKDALLLSRCPSRAVRRQWIRRIMDHDGFGADEGGIERWFRLGEAVGLSRAELEAEQHLLPGTRFAVDAYVNFVATRPWIEGVASSLTELFAPELMSRRLTAFETHYRWIEPAGLAYFRSRPPLATRDSEEALALVHEHCRTTAEQERAVGALRFKCDVLWAQLDALYDHCVDTRVRDERTQ